EPLPSRALRRRKPALGTATLVAAGSLLGPIPIRVLSRTSRLVRVPVNQWGMVCYSSTVRNEAKHSGFGRYCGRGHDSLGQGIACDRLTGKDGAEPVPDCRPMLPTSSR